VTDAATLQEIAKSAEGPDQGIGETEEAVAEEIEIEIAESGEEAVLQEEEETVVLAQAAAGTEEAAETIVIAEIEEGVIDTEDLTRGTGQKAPIEEKILPEGLDLLVHMEADLPGIVMHVTSTETIHQGIDLLLQEIDIILQFLRERALIEEVLTLKSTKTKIRDLPETLQMSDNSNERNK